VVVTDGVDVLVESNLTGAWRRKGVDEYKTCFLPSPELEEERKKT
jgi:hypothetical protein